MKKLLSVFLAIVMMLSVASGLSLTAQASSPMWMRDPTADHMVDATQSFRYVPLDDGTVQITKYIGTVENVIVPATIDGKAVTSIGMNAFFKSDRSERKFLKSVVLPEGLKEIGQGAFTENWRLTKVVFPSTLEKIGQNAFWCCYKLPEITLPEGLKVIESEAFLVCKSLKEVVVPNSVTEVGSNAFGSCVKLEKAVVPDHLKRFDCFGGCSSLISVNIPSAAETINLNDCAISEITIPSGVTKLEWNSFANCKNLKKVTLPKNLKIIEKEVFRDCTSLKSISIPAGVTEIGTGAFEGCTSLEKISIPKSNKLYATSSGVLFNKDKTELLIYPSGKKTSTYKLPSTVKKIKEGAFVGVSKTKNIEIPASVKEISTEAFFRCQGLEKINVSSKNKKYSSKDGVLFSKKKSVLYHYPSGKKNKTYVVPKTVVKLEGLAFIDNKYLTNIKIPKKVRCIEEYADSYGHNYNAMAFSNCNKLKKVYYSGSKKDWHKIYFNYNDPEHSGNQKATYMEKGQYSLKGYMNNAKIYYNSKF